MNAKLQKAFDNGSTLSYTWLRINDLLDELPSPAEQYPKISKEKWEDNMFYYCNLKRWIYRPEES